MRRSNEIRLEILPFRSLGPLRFGMTEAEVIALLGEPDRAPPQFKYDFVSWGLMPHFDDGRLDSVESYHPPCVPILFGVELVGSMSELERRLLEAGLEIRSPQAGNLDIRNTGVSLWTESEGEPVGAVGAAVRDDYWSYIPSAEPSHDRSRAVRTSGFDLLRSGRFIQRSVSLSGPDTRDCSMFSTRTVVAPTLLFHAL